jgi:hypothetical protein
MAVDFQPLGISNRVVQPVCLDAQRKGDNHDKSDAKELAQRLDRYVAGNDHALATVRIPRQRKNSGASPAASASNSSRKSSGWPPRAPY